RSPRRRGTESAPFTAVEIQDADDFVVGKDVAALDVAHQAKRCTEHVANAECYRASVQMRQIAVEQVFDDGFAARCKHVLRNLLTGRKGASGERQAAARPCQLEFKLALIVSEHDEASLRPRHLDR